MTIQLSKQQIEAIKVELAQYGLGVTVKKETHDDWIAERQRIIRALPMKSQSAFFKTTQLKLLALRRKISPEYEAFITGTSR